MRVMTGGADEELQLPRTVASAQAGDAMAFARIVAAHHEDMRRVCVVVSGDETVAEEATHAAWAIAWRKLGTVRDPARLRPWLVTIAVNEARQLLRRRRRRWLVEIPQGGSADPAGADPAEAIDAIDLRNALNRLDPDDRALLAMRYVAGFDATELSAATGLSPAGTRARLARLLAKLGRELGDG
jgi:RNA polymerase sigma-70 factor (ECF subfamily)